MLGRRPLCLCEPPRYQVSKSFTFYHYLFAFHTSRCTADRAEPSAFPCHGCNLKNNNAGEKHRKTRALLLDYNRNLWLSSRLLGTWCSNAEPICDPPSVSSLGEGETSSFTWTPCEAQTHFSFRLAPAGGLHCHTWMNHLENN